MATTCNNDNKNNHGELSNSGDIHNIKNEGSKMTADEISQRSTVPEIKIEAVDNLDILDDVREFPGGDAEWSVLCEAPVTTTDQEGEDGDAWNDLGHDLDLKGGILVDIKQDSDMFMANSGVTEFDNKHSDARNPPTANHDFYWRHREKRHESDDEGSDVSDNKNVHERNSPSRNSPSEVDRSPEGSRDDANDRSSGRIANNIVRDSSGMSNDTQRHEGSTSNGGENEGNIPPAVSQVDEAVAETGDHKPPEVQSSAKYAITEALSSCGTEKTVCPGRKRKASCLAESLLAKESKRKQLEDFDKNIRSKHQDSGPSITIVNITSANPQEGPSVHSSPVADSNQVALQEGGQANRKDADASRGTERLSPRPADSQRSTCRRKQKRPQQRCRRTAGEDKVGYFLADGQEQMEELSSQISTQCGDENIPGSCDPEDGDLSPTGKELAGESTPADSATSGEPFTEMQPASVTDRFMLQPMQGLSQTAVAPGQSRQHVLYVPVYPSSMIPLTSPILGFSPMFQTTSPGNLFRTPVFPNSLPQTAKKKATEQGHLSVSENFPVLSSHLSAGAYQTNTTLSMQTVVSQGVQANTILSTMSSTQSLLSRPEKSSRLSKKDAQDTCERTPRKRQKKKAAGTQVSLASISSSGQSLFPSQAPLSSSGQPLFPTMNFATSATGLKMGTVGTQLGGSAQDNAAEGKQVAFSESTNSDIKPFENLLPHTPPGQNTDVYLAQENRPVPPIVVSSLQVTAPSHKSPRTNTKVRSGPKDRPAPSVGKLREELGTAKDVLHAKGHPQTTKHMDTQKFSLPGEGSKTRERGDSGPRKNLATPSAEDMKTVRSGPAVLSMLPSAVEGNAEPIDLSMKSVRPIPQKPKQRGDMDMDSQPKSIKKKTRKVASKEQSQESDPKETTNPQQTDEREDMSKSETPDEFCQSLTPSRIGTFAAPHLLVDDGRQTASAKPELQNPSTSEKLHSQNTESTCAEPPKRQQPKQKKPKTLRSNAEAQSPASLPEAGSTLKRETESDHHLRDGASKTNFVSECTQGFVKKRDKKGQPSRRQNKKPVILHKQLPKLETSLGSSQTDIPIQVTPARFPVLPFPAAGQNIPPPTIPPNTDSQSSSIPPSEDGLRTSLLLTGRSFASSSVSSPSGAPDSREAARPRRPGRIEPPSSAASPFVYANTLSGQCLPTLYSVAPSLVPNQPLPLRYAAVPQAMPLLGGLGDRQTLAQSIPVFLLLPQNNLVTADRAANFGHTQQQASADTANHTHTERTGGQDSTHAGTTDVGREVHEHSESQASQVGMSDREALPKKIHKQDSTFKMKSRKKIRRNGVKFEKGDQDSAIHDNNTASRHQEESPPTKSPMSEPQDSAEEQKVYPKPQRAKKGVPYRYRNDAAWVEDISDLSDLSEDHEELDITDDDDWMPDKDQDEGSSENEVETVPDWLFQTDTPARGRKRKRGPPPTRAKRSERSKPRLNRPRSGSDASQHSDPAQTYALDQASRRYQYSDPAQAGARLVRRSSPSHHCGPCQASDSAQHSSPFRRSLTGDHENSKANHEADNLKAALHSDDSQDGSGDAAKEDHDKDAVHVITVETITKRNEKRRVENAQSGKKDVAVLRADSKTFFAAMDDQLEHIERKKQKRPRTPYTDEDLTCRECSKRFANIYRLRRHEGSHREDRPFLCDICHKGFKQSGHRNEHRLTHDTKRRRSFLCNHCGVVIGSRSSFRYHLISHQHLLDSILAGEEDMLPGGVVCVGDVSELKKGSNLKREATDTLTSATAYTAYDCPHCDDRFATAQSLNSHLESHEEVQLRCHVQPFTCDRCGRCFTYRHNLEKHRALHVKPEKFHDMYRRKVEEHIASGKPHFKCEQCGKIYLRKETLRKHEKVHSGVKPFRCDHCYKCFTQKIHLTVHLRLHTGARPFQCRSCHRCFMDSTALARHVEKDTCREGGPVKVDRRRRRRKKQVTEENDTVDGTSTVKPLKCDKCTWRGKRSGNLKNHMSRAHAKSSDLSFRPRRSCSSRSSDLNKPEPVDETSRDVSPSQTEPVGQGLKGRKNRASPSQNHVSPSQPEPDDEGTTVKKNDVSPSEPEAGHQGTQEGKNYVSLCQPEPDDEGTTAKRNDSSPSEPEAVRQGTEEGKNYVSPSQTEPDDEGSRTKESHVRPSQPEPSDPYAMTTKNNDSRCGPEPSDLGSNTTENPLSPRQPGPMDQGYTERESHVSPSTLESSEQGSTTTESTLSSSQSESAESSHVSPLKDEHPGQGYKECESQAGPSQLEPANQGARARKKQRSRKKKSHVRPCQSEPGDQGSPALHLKETEPDCEPETLATHTATGAFTGDTDQNTVVCALQFPLSAVIPAEMATSS
ncbi:hypothetical protein BaRGS_00022263 [Batillaria attramentaria]|uniref:C2H2-type domain-containing protein n=1 Tax=Batillaria attramentaria TaxID=370345 RepID=A0ABD0KHD5_9CAEN